MTEIHVSRESTYEPSLPVGGNTLQLDMNYLYTCTRVVMNRLCIFISTQSLSLLMILSQSGRDQDNSQIEVRGISDLTA
jgi:hypothetical protein